MIKNEKNNYKILFIKGEKYFWEISIGLEIHAQIASKYKLFSGASTKFGEQPNTQVSLLDLGLPGSLPVINKFCIKQAVKTGLGLNSKINLVSHFDRKHYFYPDLPLGYQISQFNNPIISGGYVNIKLKNGSEKNINLERIHLEQDAGKSIHDLHPQKTFIDLNRSGVALMEIVTKPEIKSSEEAALFVQQIRSTLLYLKTCNGNMEKGNLRVDVNISLNKPGNSLGSRVEIKNLNSIRFITIAIEYEIKRQINILEKDGIIHQETRLFNTKKSITQKMRSKEDSYDYRYFPDPDLPPLILNNNWINEINKTLPELPQIKKERLMKNYYVTSYEADILTKDPETADFFEKSLNKSIFVQKGSKKAIKMIVNWHISELFALLNKNGLNINKSKISAENLARIVDLIHTGSISGKIGKKIFYDVWDTGKSPEIIIKEQNLIQISDSKLIIKNIDIILKKNKIKLEEYKNGKTKLFGFFIGEIMKIMDGKGNPKLINTLLKEKLM